MKIGVYPGSFDPVTNGHLDIIERASTLVDTLIVGVLDNPSKIPLFTIQERIEQLQSVTAKFRGIKVIAFSGLLINFMKVNDAKIIIRGLRAVTDFEYEFQMALTNRSLDAEIETIFLATSVQYCFLSSSVVKEIAKFKGNFQEFVPPSIAHHLIEKYK